ncbi:CEI_1a_G0017910.mRNA.1.CDS.1 [Saccharomyces cerevisiae]|nr:EM14S01-3B_G0030950.mRNA.1.CDS.1 [Saccharomyces cerevisiae]CAI4451811.1 AMH_1a_G0017970.mRNA.1.CDS.1 [Saccharomyces cerevisiae]CAI4457787.1 CEI_1a_G0017910.mRNA.1.CDS.1 [Saccharomyces cerevisiae]CAI6652336.1 AMH_1a_G0017970.mRNA.1.CDS.1 [Saccharomyces cerevisiae]CAI7283341.1 CEI_1a_G0017910.mRNA.1.CDS.1 [Saccharomyces cerevisiae]
MNVPETRQSSIVVAIRVRPFTSMEKTRLVNEASGAEANFPGLGDSSLILPMSNNSDSDIDIDAEEGSTRSKRNSLLRRKVIRPEGIRKIVDCVDDRMLIFDPADRNPLNKVSDQVLNSMRSRATKATASSINNSNATNKFSSQRRRHGGEIKFVFDKLFDETSSQARVYKETTSPLLDSVLDGFNSTVFAYGATGCGKTYTVSGTPSQPGIIFLAMEELFNKITDLKDEKDFEISLSYLEIYNERIRDLLKPETPSKRLVIREDTQNHIKVANLSYHHPNTVEDVMDLVVQGNINRTTSPTEANEVSSRSHAVLQIHIMQTNKLVDLTSQHTFATLSIIDLAGSERAAATRNRGIRLHEGANINRSLLALGNCINALCLNDGSRSCHIPYRDSKLTRLLKFSLGGNCKTVMIVCISPSSSHYDETLNTLKYANRAKEIKTKIIRNQQSLSRHVGSYLKMITEQKRQIEELREREEKMISLKLTKYKLNKEKIQLAINECVNRVQQTYASVETYQVAKTLKSLILCKRRFLQMVKLEVDNLILLFKREESTAIEMQPVISNCRIISGQLYNKIHELEMKFDDTDTLSSVIHQVHSIDLNKLREMEDWDETYDLVYLESCLNQISELQRNEILVNSSIMTEKLMSDPGLNYRFKFLSKWLMNRTPNIESIIQDLVHIDEEFESFARTFIANSDSNFTTTNINIINTTAADLAVPAETLQRQNFSKKKVKWTSPDLSPSPMIEPQPQLEPELHQDQDAIASEVDVSMQDTTFNEQGPSTPSAPTTAVPRRKMRSSLLTHQSLLATARK